MFYISFGKNEIYQIGQEDTYMYITWVGTDYIGNQKKNVPQNKERQINVLKSIFGQRLQILTSVDLVSSATYTCICFARKYSL